MSDQPSGTDASTRMLARVGSGILAWYAADHRDFPWRATHDPWAVLVSEVMLQQTQASRVVQRFPPFLERFPTPRAMVDATDAEVLAAWSGLGYNRRPLALRRAAAIVVASGWPDDVAGLAALPGVGAYTARAVAALAFGRPVGAVDTNVRRWLVRRFGLPLDAAPPRLQALADRLASRADGPAEAAAWMHASMEFGARICSSRNPRCGSCPVARGCPSRTRSVHVPVTRQAPFAGSRRAARGAVLRALAAAAGHALPEAEVRGLGGEPSVLALLEADGLLHRDGGLVRLGRPAPPAAAATIGP